MFALSTLDRTRLEVSVKCEPEIAVDLRGSYAAIRPGYHLNKRHWNTITLDGRLADRLVSSPIEDSYTPSSMRCRSAPARSSAGSPLASPTRTPDLLHPAFTRRRRPAQSRSTRSWTSASASGGPRSSGRSRATCSRPPSRWARSSAKRLRQRLDPRPIALDDDEHASALAERLDDLAGEPEHRGFVGRAVADGERLLSLGEPLEHPAQRRAQDRGVLLHQLGIGVAQRGQVAAAGALVGLAPAILDARAQPGLDDGASRDGLAQHRREAGERLGRPLRAGRDQQRGAAGQGSPDLQRVAHALLGQGVAVVVGVAAQLDVAGHRGFSRSGAARRRWCVRQARRNGAPPRRWAGTRPSRAAARAPR